MNVFNVPASAPFLHTVVAALVEGRLVKGFDARSHPERLADATLYLPTRRAGRMVREIFLDILKTDAVMLPRIVMLGDIDEDELTFAQAAVGDPIATLNVPSALGGLERRLVLAQLIAAWAKTNEPANPAETPLVIGGPASTLILADDLARLMDDMATHGLPWQALNDLVPDNFDMYWQSTLNFLRIAVEAWPHYLAERGKIEPARRRDLLIEAETVRLATHRGPVIAAGSTGSMPATAKFLHVIAKLPHGAVVLPGLDVDLEESAWQLIGGREQEYSQETELPSSSHPQFALHALLTRFGITRADVKPLAGSAPFGREMLISEAMRPSSATSQWRHRLAEDTIARRISDGMTQLAVVEAPTSDKEALAIAIAMRETYEETDKTAALVTADRSLARRVMASLERWELPFDDSAGKPLLETPAGLFARHIAAAMAEGLSPATLLAFLKHPLFRLEQAKHAFTNAIECLELALLRGTRPQSGSVGLRRDFISFRTEWIKLHRGEPSLLHHSEARAHLDATALADVERLIERLHIAFAPFEDLTDGALHDFTDVAACHRSIIEALSRDERGVVTAFEKPDGLALAKAFDDLASNGSKSGVALTIADYPDVFQAAFKDRIVHRPQAANARLHIYGPLEARLTHCDRMILGGLTEGVWPPDPPIDPWLNRPMRHQLGLDLPERRIGLSAHDFAQLCGAPEVILTHATKVSGAPAIASRFLHRLKAVAGEECWAVARNAGAAYLIYADALDRPDVVQPISPPQPKPPRYARPLRLSVTDIEHWLRDPYTIYAKHILGLHAFDPVDMPLSAANRGEAIHHAIGEFTQTFRAQLPDDPAAALRCLGEKHFASLMDRPEVRALWWPRFLRIASWFVGWDFERRQSVSDIAAEIRGEIAIPIDLTRTFRLSARADRIERRLYGTYAILDYKTGQVPTDKQVRLGLSPQLTLEAAILREGGFKDIPANASVSELTYVRLSGNTPPGEEKPLDSIVSADEAASDARTKLETLIRAFEDENQAYRSLNLSMWSSRYGAYDDLARIKEWSTTEGGDGGRA